MTTARDLLIKKLREIGAYRPPLFMQVFLVAALVFSQITIYHYREMYEQSIKYVHENQKNIEALIEITEKIIEERSPPICTNMEQI